eukprot:TRINITY_DN44536_c0_g1_i1.p1 TRINITY_DN44536_c0_g1~~TRINITY_DN44536_c0_g1_i1.p1  ORF type:complete len:388 (+),score=53.14 TRINITY_DN44536_c0_g1_i1:92-1165(+)
MEGRPAHYRCDCMLTQSFFVRSANGSYFSYDGDDAEFAKQYNEAVREAPSGAVLSTLEETLAEVKRQQDERRRSPQESSERAQTVAQHYTRLHPDVYQLDTQRFLAPAFRQLVEAVRGCKANPTAVTACVDDFVDRGIIRVVREDILCFPVFSEEFCALLDEELRNFERSGLPKTAPNSMNRFGVIMRELGFSKDLLDPIAFEYIDPIAQALLPEQTESIDSYRAFTVQYDATKDGDKDLSLHYDNAEITLNVNIGGDWTGGQVSFFAPLGCSEESAPPTVSVSLERGHGILHSARVMHRADPVVSGRRENLIIWCRSSAIRNEQCPMCFRRPCCLPTNEYIHEGFSVPPCRLSTCT